MHKDCNGGGTPKLPGIFSNVKDTFLKVRARNLPAGRLALQTGCNLYAGLRRAQLAGRPDGRLTGPGGRPASGTGATGGCVTQHPEYLANDVANRQGATRITSSRS